MRLILRACDGLTVAEIPWDTTKHTGCPELVFHGDRLYVYDYNEGDGGEPTYSEVVEGVYVVPEEVKVDVEWKYADAIIELAEKIKQHKALKRG